VDRDVETLTLLEVVERRADFLDRLIRAVEGGSENRDDANRVLVTQLHGFFRGQMEAVPIHRD
jgi:hypothetical protein